MDLLPQMFTQRLILKCPALLTEFVCNSLSETSHIRSICLCAMAATIDDERVNQYAYSPPEGPLKDNSSLDTKPVIVHDARGREAKFSTDTSASQCFRC